MIDYIVLHTTTYSITWLQCYIIVLSHLEGELNLYSSLIQDLSRPSSPKRSYLMIHWHWDSCHIPIVFLASYRIQEKSLIDRGKQSTKRNITLNHFQNGQNNLPYKNRNFNHVEVEVAVTSAFGISQISNSNHNRIQNLKSP